MTALAEKKSKAKRASFLRFAGWLAALFFVAAAPAFAEGTLRLGLQLEPPSLDPTSGPAAAIREATFRSVFEGLVRLGPSGRVEPLLATSWSLSPDGRVYSFALRPGVRFHNGVPFDSAVVRFSFERARAATSTNGQKSVFARIEAIETPDPLHVRIRLKTPYSRFLQVLGWGDAVMVEPSSAATNAVRPVGTGPFRFGDWRRGDRISLDRFDGYWGPKAKLDQVIFRVIGDPTAAGAALEAGDLDGFAAFPAPELLGRFRKDLRFRVEIGPSEGKTLLGLNNQRGPLSDLRVRRALSMAVDRKAVIAAAMFGYGRPIGSHFTPGDPGYVDLTGAYPFDPARARALLAEAGYPNGFETTIALPPLAYARRSGEVIERELARIGVRARLEPLEWAAWLDRVFARKDFDMTIVAHVEPLDLDIYARDDYYFGYRNPAYKALMAHLDAATTEAEARALMGEAQRRLSADAVNVWLFELPATGVFDARIKGLWSPTPVGAINLADAEWVGGAPKPGGGVEKGAGAPVLFWPTMLAAVLGLFALGWRKAGAVFVLRKLGGLLATLFAASLVIFLALQIAPGDPARFIMGLNADPAALAALRHEMGLDADPLHRYLAWLAGLARGDMGVSYAYHAPVAGLIAERLSLTLPLTLMALGLSTLLALMLGVAARLERRGWAERLVQTLAAAGVAIPGFWLGMLLAGLFAGRLHWMSAGGFPGWSAGLLPCLRALALPALALALPQAAVLTRVLNGALAETLSEDFVRTARAKGLGRSAALLRHALPNALGPVLTIIGLQFGFLLAGAAIIEETFYLPGLGRLVFQAVAGRDLMVVQGAVLVLVAAVTLAAFLVDLALAAIDPRIGDAETRGGGA